MAPWHSDMNLTNSAQSPSRSLGVGSQFYFIDWSYYVYPMQIIIVFTSSTENWAGISASTDVR